MQDTFDQTEFRAVLGTFATGVVIVSSLTDGKPIGMTIGAFTSVSLDPPLIAFLPAKSSKTWPMLRTAKAFTVNILASDQQTTCRSFAKTSDKKFDGLDWQASPFGTPHLAGALAWLDCELERVFEAGDHDIALGRVKSLKRGLDRDPLVFYRGQFHAILPTSEPAAT